ncbi:MAG: hypothetical protein ACFFG0_49395 [Candidatus Thorarchaeota archaeon]
MFRHVYLILKAKKRYSLLHVKREFQNRNLSLIDTRKLIYTIMTTERPRGKASSWASRTSHFYKRRCLIETGFSNLSRFYRR